MSQAQTQLAAQAVLHTVFAAKDGATLKTNSRFVAEAFGRQHKNVLQAYDALECSDEFSRLNFQPAEYLDAQGKARVMIEMTFDGFMFLVMGFTGAKAAAIKEAYIAEFNRMRAELRQQQQAAHMQALLAAEEKAAYFEKYARLPILPLTPATVQRVHQLLAERTPVADVARICRCSQATVRMLRDSAAATHGDLFARQGATA